MTATLVSAPASPARVLIVDRLAVTRRALRLALGPEAGLDVVAEAAGLADALAAIAAGLDVDVVALDGRAARPDPAGAIAAFGVPVVIMRVEDGPDFVAASLSAGAAGQARKDDVGSIVDALTHAVVV